MHSTYAEREHMLASLPFFAAFPGPERETLASLLRPHRVEADELIFEVGDPGDAFFVIQAGSVQVFATRPHGSALALHRLGPGDSFGELALCDGQPRSATVRAVEPTDLWVLSRAEFLQYLQRYPSAALHLLAVLSQHIRRLTDATVEALTLDLQHRLARRLLEVARQGNVPTHSGLTLEQRVTRQDLAGMVGATAARVALVLSAWQQMGILDVQADDTVVVRDIDALEAFGRDRLVSQPGPAGAPPEHESTPFSPPESP